MLKVSVIVPSYKPGDYLNECLKSIFYQTINSEIFEVIIVLNGPKEPFYSQIEQFISLYNNFQLIYENVSGVSHARNIGILTARGEYLCFIDDDDVVSPMYLERLLEHATSDTISMSNVYSFKANIEERNENFFICRQLKNKHLYKNASFYTCRSFLAFPVAKMIHRNIIAEHRFDTRFANGEDALFITSITDNLARITFTPDDAIYYVRERIGSATRRKFDRLKLISDTTSLIFTYISTYLKNPRKYSFLLFVARIPGVIKGAYALSRNKR